jgi:predicted NUDIX family NTP pyrophosphohydrolase
MSSRVSAGILLFRRSGTAPAGVSLEVLLGHPGGPYAVSRDHGYWTIPKGEVDEGDDLLDVAYREFEEETGHSPPAGTPLPLGTTRQKGGKLVHAWALRGDLDPSAAFSNTFTMEWPPGSGGLQEFPEIDRVEWFAVDEALRRIKDAQAVFIERLEEALCPPQEALGPP